MSESLSWAYVALGSNEGDPCPQVLAAIDRLRKFSDHPLEVSSLWESAPVGCPPGSPPFVNAVVGFIARPAETPETLLVRLQDLEREFGRRPKRITNEPRPLDLDLIAFGAEQRDTAHLKLPHPRAHQRRFVLAPLAEIAPDLRLPGQTISIAKLLSANTETGVRKLSGAG